jgi:hypothetical protein
MSNLKTLLAVGVAACCAVSTPAFASRTLCQSIQLPAPQPELTPYEICISDCMSQYPTFTLPGFPPPPSVLPGISNQTLQDICMEGCQQKESPVCPGGYVDDFGNGVV